MSKLLDSVKDSVQKAIASGKGHNNFWVTEDEGEVYIRVYRIYIEQKLYGSIDIATINIFEEFQGKGILKSILAYLKEVFLTTQSKAPSEVECDGKVFRMQ